MNREEVGAQWSDEVIFQNIPTVQYIKEQAIFASLLVEPTKKEAPSGRIQEPGV